MASGIHALLTVRAGILLCMTDAWNPEAGFFILATLIAYIKAEQCRIDMLISKPLYTSQGYMQRADLM